MQRYVENSTLRLTAGQEWISQSEVTQFKLTKEGLSASFSCENDSIA